MAYKFNKETGEITTFTVSEQVVYNAKRSKKGTRDRNGKLLSDFRRGQALGKAQGLSEGAKIANKVKKQSQKGQKFKSKKKKIKQDRPQYGDKSLNPVYQLTDEDKRVAFAHADHTAHKFALSFNEREDIYQYDLKRMAKEEDFRANLHDEY